MALRILLVEDDPHFRDIFSTALEVRGHRVRQTGSARKALELLRGEQPDIIISDMEMVGMDGRHLCRHVCADSEYAGIPFVILSAHVEADGSDPLAGLPADCCLSKQAPFSKLIEQIEKLLIHSGKRRQSGGL